MRVQISARHCSIPDPVRDRALHRVEALSKYESRLSSADVVFDEEKHVKSVEGVLTIDGEEPVVASAQGEDFRRALDQLVDRLAKILRRRRSQRRDHRATPLSEVSTTGETGPLE